MGAAGFASVGLGAALGAWLRWWLGLRFNAVYTMVPLGTLAANLIGGLLVGVAVAFFQRHPELAPQYRLFVITGFMGGLTTFSTFSAEVTLLMADRQFLWAAGLAALHLLGSLALTAVGIALVSLVARAS